MDVDSWRESDNGPLNAAELEIYNSLRFTRPSSGQLEQKRSSIRNALAPAGNRETELPLVNVSGTLGRRRSIRLLHNPISLEQLAKFINASGLNPHREAPHNASTGGLASLVPLLQLNSVTGLVPGLYLPTTRGVQLIAPTNTVLRAITRSVGASLGSNHAPAVIILILAEWDRISERYENATLVSALWDAGVVLGAAYNAATELQLAGCASSKITPNAVATVLGVPATTLGHIATFALGGPAPNAT